MVLCGLEIVMIYFGGRLLKNSFYWFREKGLMHACKLSQIFQLRFFFSRSKELQSKPASQHLIERRTANYGAPSASDSNAVDLHNKEFCVDVSTYLPVEWQEVEAEQCDTVFVKQCEDREEDVCAEVTETRCQVRT